MFFFQNHSTFLCEQLQMVENAFCVNFEEKKYNNLPKTLKFVQSCAFVFTGAPSRKLSLFLGKRFIINFQYSYNSHFLFFFTHKCTTVVKKK